MERGNFGSKRQKLLDASIDVVARMIFQIKYIALDSIVNFPFRVITGGTAAPVGRNSRVTRLRRFVSCFHKEDFSVTQSLRLDDEVPVNFVHCLL